LKITLLANRDLAANIALNYLIPQLRGHKLTLFLSDQIGGRASVPQPLIDLQFFEQQLFNRIVFPAVDTTAPAAIKNGDKLKTFSGLQNKLCRPIESLNQINQPCGLDKLRASRPDVILSIRFGKILQEQAIKCARHCVLNLHSGILPAYRGVMPTFRAMMNGDSEYGITLHTINNSAIDEGSVVSEARLPLDLSKSYLENVIALYRPGCRLMLDAVKTITDGEPLPTIAQKGRARYYSFPTSEQLLQFQARQMRLYDPRHIMRLFERYR